MNVYEKLTKARLAFQQSGAKMTGNNKFAGYSYFELGDILPVINQLSAEIKFTCEVSFNDTLATLTFRDTEKPEDLILFTSPMSTASLKGCHEVQNLGAVETYIKRYLYQNCFEIVEVDSLNKTHNPNDKKTEPVDTEKVSKLKAELKQYCTTDAQKAWLENTKNPEELEKALTKILTDKTIYKINKVFDGEVE